jgi:hypothetical protein
MIFSHQDTKGTKGSERQSGLRIQNQILINAFLGALGVLVVKMFNVSLKGKENV